MPPILIEPEPPPVRRQDAEAVGAVRRGDAGRYRELVERYERQVYAVAWSHLGDATLAEEATQEAFIRAYRSLPLLGDGEKFAAWISTIARNLAISLGLRHRRELNNRQRWALEQPVAESPLALDEPACTPEMLRQTLADLPPAHRECLVLYYLEEKSGAEAAAALGLTETALRMRLSRAWVALREKLEERLGKSLEQLRPTRSLAPSVMGVVLATSPVKTAGGAGLGATLTAAAGKVLPFKFVAVFLPAVAMAPGLGMAWWMGRSEQRNFRDPQGFRARLHRAFFRRMIWFSVASLLVAFTFGTLIAHSLDLQTFILAVGFFGLLLLTVQIRQLWVNRNRFLLGMFANGLITTCSSLAVGFGLLPLWSFNFAVVLGALVMIPTMRARPMRMDYSLFLRAIQGLLPNDPGAAPGRESTRFRSRTELLAFARFLSERFLTLNYRWAEGGLQLCLPAYQRARFSQLSDVFSLRWRKSSWIQIGWDGTIEAHCGSRDQAEMRADGAAALHPIAELEAQVAAAVQSAWDSLRDGDLATAERQVGQVPDAEVFRVPPTRALAYRVWAVFMFICLAAMIYCQVKVWRIQYRSAKAEPFREQSQAEMKTFQAMIPQQKEMFARINDWSQQQLALRRQVRDVAPGEAEQLQSQIQELQRQIDDEQGNANDLQRQMDTLNTDIRRLQKQFSETINPPAAK